jgi:hypothetical protein
MAYFRRVAACCDEDDRASPVAEFEATVDLLMEGLAGPAWRNT